MCTELESQNKKSEKETETTSEKNNKQKSPKYTESYTLTDSRGSIKPKENKPQENTKAPHQIKLLKTSVKEKKSQKQPGFKKAYYVEVNKSENDKRRLL